MSEILRTLFAFVLYLVFQVFLFDYLLLFQVAKPFVFLLFLLTLPFSYPTPLLMLLAFVTGLSVDLLSEQSATGLNSFACVAMMAARGRLADLVSSSSFRTRGEIQLRNQSTLWLASYLGPLILFHHLLYFYLEAFSFLNFFFTLGQALLSAAYTLSISFILAYLLYKR
jgi:hypothetical protein